MTCIFVRINRQHNGTTIFLLCTFNIQSDVFLSFMTACLTKVDFLTNSEYQGFEKLCFFQHKLSQLNPQIISHRFHGISRVDLDRQHNSIPHHHVLPWNAEPMDISGKIWHYVARNRNSKSGGWFVKEFNKGGPENQWNTEPIDTSGRVWKYILAFSLQPKESCLHELVAKSSLSAVLRFLASSHKQKCMIEEETNLDEFLGHQRIKPYIPIKPNGSFHEMAQLNHDQLKIVLIFIKKMLQLMTMKYVSTVIPLHYTILDTGGWEKQY